MIICRLWSFLFLIKRLESLILHKISIVENHFYTNPIIDIQQLLIDKQISGTERQNKSKIYSVPDTKSLFSLDNNKLYVIAKVDREAICSKDGTEAFTSSSSKNPLIDGSCSKGDCCTIFSFQVDSGNNINSYYILVTILDQNDNVPRFPAFTNPYATLSESIPINTIIELPLAVDDDSEEFGVMKYVISEPFLLGNASHFLLSDQLSLGRAHLVTVCTLDREKVSVYKFILKAIDRDNDKSHGNNEVEVEIKIADVNDNSPTFDKSIYLISIKEHSPLEEIIFFKISDPDEGSNSEVTVTMEIENSMEMLELRKWFRIDFSRSSMSGSLRLVNDLDYEVHRHKFFFNLIAKDNGKPSLSSSAKVSINLLNENDHAPDIRVIREGKIVTTAIRMPENEPSGTLVALLQVADKDKDITNIECLLINSNLNFHLKSINDYHPLGLYKEYTIRTIRPLDREDDGNSFLSIVIHCSDHDKVKPLSRNFTIYISVEDVNDNPPVFSRTKYQGELLENSPHVAVHMFEKIHSTDKDDGKNALVKYKMDTTTNSTDWDLFTIDPNLGTIYSKTSIDYEVKKVARFSIIAVDREQSKLSTTAHIVIHIVDANDNSPVFAMSQYSFSVMENVHINTIFGQIFATDADTKAENKNVKYFAKYFQNSPQLIHVDQNSGKLRTIATIDREKTKSISMLITAKNEAKYHGNNLVDPECMVVVVVEDDNDNAPSFKLIHSDKTTLTFYVNTAVKQENCLQIPYAVSDADQDEQDDCCTLKLDNDFNGRFYLTPLMNNFLCLQGTDTSLNKYVVSVIASDNRGQHNKSLETKISFNVYIKNELGEQNYHESMDNRAQINTIASNRTSNHSLIIAIAVVVVVCLLIISFVLIILYRYVANTSEEIQKREDGPVSDYSAQRPDSSLVKIECNANLWPQDDRKCVYNFSTQRKDNLFYTKPQSSQEWFFEKPIYNKEVQDSYQSMITPSMKTKMPHNYQISYEPLCLIPSNAQEYISIDNKLSTHSTKYTKSDIDNDANINNENTPMKYCQTSFV